MIDRITFRIEDCDLEKLSTRFPLDEPMFVNQDTGDINKGAHVGNLKLVILSCRNLSLKGSLRKYKHDGQNYNSFTPREAQEAIVEYINN